MLIRLSHPGAPNPQIYLNTFRRELHHVHTESMQLDKVGLANKLENGKTKIKPITI